MNFIRRIFSRPKGSSTKASRPDSPTNKVIKKILFYGFFLFTTATILSKKYKTNLIFTCQPTEQNKRIIEYNSVFHQGVYYPTYWMVFSPLQRIYAKYMEESPYFRPTSQPATKEFFQTHSLPVADKHSKVLFYERKKENLSVVLVIAGCEGLNVAMQKIMLSMNINGYRVVGVRPDDFHSIERLQKTIDRVKGQNPNCKMYGIGLDYGANLLVNLAGKNSNALNSIVSVGNPLDLEQSQKNIENSNFIWKKLLYKDMLKGRIEACQQNRKIFGQQTIPLTQQTTSLYDIDKSCYSSSYQSYPTLKQKLSSINQIKNLKTPSLFIQSQEDPCTISIEQNQQKLQNSNCIFVETQRGGHGEWFESMKQIRWVTRPIVHFFKYQDSRYAY